MIADHLIEILRCPQDRWELNLADAELSPSSIAPSPPAN